MTNDSGTKRSDPESGETPERPGCNYLTHKQKRNGTAYDPPGLQEIATPIPPEINGILLPTEKIFNRIVAVVRSAYRIASADEMFRDSKQGRGLHARHLLRYFLKQHLPITLAEIGRLTPRAGVASDHSSVIHSIRVVKNRRDTEPKYDLAVSTIEEFLARDIPAMLDRSPNKGDTIPKLRNGIDPTHLELEPGSIATEAKT